MASVVTTINLPDETGADVVHHFPLKGDGLSHSFAQLLVSVSQLTDNTGNFNQIVVNFDPNFAHLVQHVGVHWSQATARDVPYRINFRCSDYEIYEIDGIAVNRDVGYTSGSRASMLWTPPPSICRTDDVTPFVEGNAGQIIVRSPNTIANEDLNIQISMLQLTKQAPEMAFYGQLVSALSRASVAINS